MAKPLRQRTIIARNLRRNATFVERRLWRALLDMENPWKFRRQHPVGRHVVDFACTAQKLAIELDGGQHAERQAEDCARTAELGKYGYRVIRFWNSEVIEDLNGVLDAILRALGEPHLPQPLRPVGRRGDCDRV